MMRLDDPIAIDAVELVRNLSPECRVGPSEQGWCCEYHEGLARRLLRVIGHAAVNPMLWLQP